MGIATGENLISFTIGGIFKNLNCVHVYINARQNHPYDYERGQKHLPVS